MAIIPDQLRPALDDPVAGRRPELLTWVRAYGTDGAVLARQAEDIWTLRDSSALNCQDRSVAVVLPLWTTSESPGDLSAECTVQSRWTRRDRRRAHAEKRPDTPRDTQGGPTAKAPPRERGGALPGVRPGQTRPGLT
ncbi:hypothetical protein [Nakamurella sp.]|uniref:DUF7668 domain-containing protein n=1 Tax=Nakamurella sp. TaxID=1869182 RepID=UPI003782D933